MKRRGGDKDDLHALGRLRATRAANQAPKLCQGLRGESGDNFGKLAAGKQSIVQDAVPLALELARTQDRVPGLPHDVVAGALLASHDQPQHFDGGSAAEQRKNQRLDDAERTANRTRVAPRFEVVSARDMPFRL